MALSVAGVIGWDFTAAVAPLASKVGQAATFSAEGGAVVDTTDGFQATTASDRLKLVCTAEGALVGWTLPYTFLTVITHLRSGSATTIPIGARMSSGHSVLLGARAAGNSGGLSIVSTTGVNTFTSLPDSVETICITEIRANGMTQWFGASQTYTNTNSYSVPSLATSDYILLGPSDSNTGGFTAKGFALIPGLTTSDDRTALAADWRVALFGAPGPTPAAIAYYRRHLGGLTE